MEHTTPAEELPALYRAVLDRVAELEAGGRRSLANQVRSEATRIYSRAWDDRARRGLTELLRRNTDDPLGQPAAGRGLRRRSVRAA
jgi:hypothetical protein